MSEFLDRLPEFAPIIQKSLRSLVVFTAAIDTDRRSRQRIEGAFALHITNQPGPAGALLAGDVRYYRRKATEDPITVRISCPFLIHGMPEELEA